MKIFEYRKNNNGYLNGVKLHQQVVKKALPTIEAHYPSFLLLFFFDNATYYFVYVNDVLQVKDMNKSTRIQ